MIRKALLGGLIVSAIFVAAGCVWTVRWVLAWDDLAAYAKPAGYDQIAHRWQCEGMGDCLTLFGKNCDAYCYHDWVYVSDEHTYRNTVIALAERYREMGWLTRGCGPGEFFPFDPDDPCGLGAVKRDPITGRWEECYRYSDFKGDVGFRQEWRRGFESRIEEARSAILVSTSCG